MKCPRCESTQLRKNGFTRGKQQYFCKICGRYFIDDFSSVKTASQQENMIEVVRQKKSELPVNLSSLMSSPDSEIIPARQSIDPGQYLAGLAILLLDVENLKLDLNAEKFLTDISHYPLQVKIAFANWRNPSLSKQDAELYDRGYQLIHVPEGKNSADAQMIAMGVSIPHHYPEAKAVFVCSSDWLLTHLCNELQCQGLIVYRVRRQNKLLSVENRQTGEVTHYSLEMEMAIPSLEELVKQVEAMLQGEMTSISDRISQLSTLTNLFQQRRHITLNSKIVNDPEDNRKTQDINQVIPEKKEPESIATNKDNNSKPTGIATVADLASINSKEKLEQVFLEILETMKNRNPKLVIDTGKLGAEFHGIYGIAPSALIKKLGLGSKLSTFLKSCKSLKLKN
ncbi:IS1/IS1595 family N-terminal zinc-binding domain-containing protein [Limnofasciculus baicalensis]|uniref:NYN domain-containing protein n=1 Tax=Limnofasciculus baicalensis BBK-W-15 TaxID=2699891 RepID=A0AAE3KPR5_9CYAN|nr:NYN domain-containing protein [Limnofasciculus baicalensis]MCP2729943.1 NYN domain-containing protein [Limnofasciculus baicalensis BBK-W-15]